MRRILVLASLLGLTACGGSEDITPGAPGALSQVEQEAICGSANAWECFCASQKTEDACRQATSTNGWHCYWQSLTLSTGRCLPTYE
ncbi:hypothetical protein LZ198_15190 [Myxococcus sp. K15C18031901]|uniref:hypothetical protein n=1 Tax=Myxococcus dinghuensis TaxID=2906761 RepID=UPI0020A7F66D|nr:hypothetical protein [Myxococcus dinghuensis]MCP3100216.1 hypothetical protein [Myxococcus dinghuensis]